MRLKTKSPVIMNISISKKQRSLVEKLNKQLEKENNYKVGLSLIIETAIQLAFTNKDNFIEQIKNKVMEKILLQKKREKLRYKYSYERRKKLK